MGPPVHGQEFPVRAVRIVTADAGSTNDIVTRVIAQGLAVNLGQQVFVENRGGASGVPAAQAVARASPDGYTVLLYSNTLWIGPLLQDAVADPLRDLAPVVLAASSPNMLTVHPSLPVKTVGDLVTLAKRRPRELNYASTSTGSSNHLGAELFKSMAGVDMVRVNFKGGGAALNAVVAGEVHLTFVAAGAASPHVRSGRLRALAICTRQPSAVAPDLPTMADAAGLPGFESASVYGVFVPARTPPALVARWNQEFLRALARSEAKERFLNLGVEPIGSTPGGLAATVKSDIAVVTRLIKEGSLRAQ